MQDLQTIDQRYTAFHRLFAGDFNLDVPIYLDLAAKHDEPVLVVGCGVGRIMAYLSSSGHDVLGIDTCRPMLEVAVQDLRPWPERARIQDFDLRRQAHAERFRVAIGPLFYFNALIDIEEQRLLLRHLRRSMASPGVVALDLFCPRSLVRSARGGDWQRIERRVEGHHLVIEDRREMLTPLLEKRTQRFSIDGQPGGEHVQHRRYVPPSQAARLLEEAGFEDVQWIHAYDSATLGPITDDSRPEGPFMILARS